MSTLAPTPGKPLIWLAAPAAGSTYYAGFRAALRMFYTRLRLAVEDREQVVIVADPSTQRHLALPLSVQPLGEGLLADIWLRDVAPIATPAGRVKGRYQPSYLSRRTAARIEAAFHRWYQPLGLETRSLDLRLDGGNYVYDGQQQAILTDRVFVDNPALSPPQLRRWLESWGLVRVGFLPEEAGDRCGHADGMVKWLSPTRLAVNAYPEPFRSIVLGRIESIFPDVELIELPYAPGDRRWRGWPDARGNYANALETEATVYVPTYGLEEDLLALDQYRRHTAKRVVGIDMSGLCAMGGSLHCLTWELSGGEAARVAKGTVTPA